MVTKDQHIEVISARDRAYELRKELAERLDRMDTQVEDMIYALADARTAVGRLGGESDQADRQSWQRKDGWSATNCVTKAGENLDAMIRDMQRLARQYSVQAGIVAALNRTLGTEYWANDDKTTMRRQRASVYAMPNDD